VLEHHIHVKPPVLALSPAVLSMHHQQAAGTTLQSSCRIESDQHIHALALQVMGQWRLLHSSVCWRCAGRLSQGQHRTHGSRLLTRVSTLVLRIMWQTAHPGNRWGTSENHM